jgi:Tetratricopeptide repeat/Bacterial SH3 domain
MNMTKRNLLLGSTFLFYVGYLHAANPVQTKFLEANKAFESGEIEKAQELYEDVGKQGFEGSAFYYNRGNLHYRKGERGKAILWYERALRLSPRDADIKYNLTLAKSHIKDEKPNILENIVFFFSLSELGWTLTLLIWAFFILLGARTLGWITNEAGVSLSLWFSGFLLLIVGGWFGVNAYFSSQSVAIVMVPPGEVRNGPGTDYAVGFTIPEGSKVVVLNKRPEWIQVGVPQQGLKGWMPAAEIETVSVNPIS